MTELEKSETLFESVNFHRGSQVPADLWLVLGEESDQIWKDLDFLSGFLLRRFLQRRPGNLTPNKWVMVVPPHTLPTRQILFVHSSGKEKSIIEEKLSEIRKMLNASEPKGVSVTIFASNNHVQPNWPVLIKQLGSTLYTIRWVDA